MSAYAVSSRGLAAHKLPQGVLATVMEMLYANSEKGIAKLDFSDFTGMYQDRARTVPYTAVEQPLGSFTGLNGVAATAPADVNRGVVSARVNVLLNTENPSAWPTIGITGTAEAGGVSLLQSTIDNSGVSPGLQYPIGAAPITNSCIYRSIEYLPGDALYLAYGPADGGGQITVRTSDGVVVGTAGGTRPTRKITQLNDGWVRLETWDSLASHNTSQISNNLYFGNAFSAPYIANGGRAGTQIRVRRPQYVVLPFGSTHSVPYQRVNTATDYDTAGFPHYLAFNGTNTAYATPSIDFTGTDKMTVWAGVTKLSDATTGALLELSANSSTTAGTLMLRAVDYPGGPEYTAYGRGASAYVGIAAGIAAAPSTRLLTEKVDFAAATGQQVLARLNGVNGGAAATDTGGGSFIAAPLYIGARAGTSLFFNGRLYSLIARGAQSSLSQIEATELYIKRKMRLP